MLMKTLAVLLFAGSVIALAASAHLEDLQERYPFSAVLLDDGEEYYELHWNFTRSTQSIYFAVNVSTTGWVGFGLSPNGQMPASDVVMGWVGEDGDSHFWDRYAEARRQPVIDTQSQDWFLVNSREEGGFTLLEFSRNFTSCDPQDLDITVSTSRVIWSYSEADPTDPTGADAVRHSQQGSISLNLLGGQPVRNNAIMEDEPFLNLAVVNVTIPRASTTYWCQTFRAPEELRDTVHYINRFAPSISPHTRSYVHHIVVAECPTPLTEEQVGMSASCTDLDDTNGCRQGVSIGSWAVGGEEFNYPDGVAYPIGGTGEDQFFIIELHYDNPNNVEGIVDSSGMRFYYTTEEPVHKAGAVTFGHNVVPFMYIPPNTRNFTTVGICPADCTNQYIPEGGINIFASFLHTHLAGRGLRLEHYRYNTDCDVWEELEPIDQNLNYDFNYQQFTHLPREHRVLPGDIVVLKCFYDTTGRDNVTIGGLSTIEEMCLSFTFYYPRPAHNNILDVCLGFPNPQNSFTDFFHTLQRIDPATALMFTNPNTAVSALNSLDWTGNPQLVTALERSLGTSTGRAFCSTIGGDISFADTETPVTECSYQAADRCSEFEPLSCCERVGDGALPQVQISLSVGFLALLISVWMTAA